MINENEQSLANRSADIPLFYLGDDHTFRPLARRLSAEHEFQSLSIELPPIGQVKNPYSLRCIAEHFASGIRELQPRGPYMLGGWGAHGLLALETAQHLREHGQEIVLLVLLETINPERLRHRGRWIHRIASWQTKKNRMPAREHASVRSTRKFTGRNLGNMRGSKSKKMDLSRSTPLEILSAAAANYLPRPYDGPVLLMRSGDVFAFDKDAHLGWGKILGQELEICETRGHRHSKYAEPNVQELAEQVGAHLRKAELRWRRRSREERQLA